MIKPLNGNLLVEHKRNQTEKIFKEDDSRRDLQYATVKALPLEEITIRDDDGNPIPLKLEDVVVYNPRSMTPIVYNSVAYGMIHNQNLLAVV